MSWTDIEAKWAAMTRRVQSDRARDDDDRVSTRVPALAPSLRGDATETRAPLPFDRPAA